MKGKLLGAASAMALAVLGHSASPQDAQALSVTYGTALDPITIFATLSPIASFDYPGQVTVIEREEIETHQANSLTDVIKDVPGVFVDGGARRSGQAPTIHGFGEEDILILVDRPEARKCCVMDRQFRPCARSTLFTTVWSHPATGY